MRKEKKAKRHRNRGKIEKTGGRERRCKYSSGYNISVCTKVFRREVRNQCVST